MTLRLLRRADVVVRQRVTLADVADRYRVSEDSLRRVNRIQGDALTAGVVLAVPVSVPR